MIFPRPLLLISMVASPLGMVNAKPWKMPGVNPLGFPRRLRASLRTNQRVLENTTTTPSCSNDAFLWLVKKEETVVGFGVGTMHVKRELVLSDDQWQSLVAAAADACTVYGEYDTTEPGALDEVSQACLPEEPVLVSDIPNQELKEAYEAKILEITTEYFPQASQALADQFAASLPLEAVEQLVLAWNTPEMRDWYMNQIFDQGDENDFDAMDTDLLELGSPSGSLETLEESCTYMAAISPDKQDFLNNFEEVYENRMWQLLDANESPLFEAYKCGTAEGVIENIDMDLGDGTVVMDDKIMDALLDGRNIVMAGRMVDIMGKPNSTLPMFAVGLAHWIYGSNSLEILLEKEGHTLERVQGSYDAGLLPDAVCEDTSEALRWDGNLYWVVRAATSALLAFLL